MTSKTADPNLSQAPGFREWSGLIITYLSIPVILIICGGDVSWWQGWVFSVLFFFAGVSGRYLAEKRHPGIMVERASMEKAKNAKQWDKVLAPLMAISFAYPLVIVAGIDHRYGWTPLFATWLNVFGFVLITLGYAFAIWALIENRFFATTVQIQTDRGHTVCDSGPYRIVRHPGYAGNLLALPGVVLALDSVWTLIPAFMAIIIAVIRTELEDRTLQEELKGYKEYVQQVRYKLVPGIY